ncbi:hypothetical protein ABZ897_12075 [Nonomuraea sp. NPDC046802]|uniref:hypothetical protein n=1 Tax=Nonomuraea sp. NPDC046802 TaxID=3154919 RepID=UPI0033DF552D
MVYRKPSESWPWAPLVEGARDTDWPHVCAHAADLLVPVLGYIRRPPDGLIKAALGHPALVAALAANKNLADWGEDIVDEVTAAALEQVDDRMVVRLVRNPATSRRLDVCARVAASGSLHAVLHGYDLKPAASGSLHPVLRADDVPWTLRTRRVLFAAATRFDVNDRLVSTLMRTIETARPLVVSPRPDLVHQVLAVHGPLLTEEEQLRAVLSIWQHGGGAAAVAALDTAGLRPDVREVVAEVDIDVLRVALAQAKGTCGAIRELRDPDTHDHADRLSIRDRLDWYTIRATDDHEPFNAPASAALAARPDCPRDFRLLLYARHPAATARQLLDTVPVDWDALRELDRLRPLGEEAAARAAGRRDCPEGLRITLLRRFPPAVATHTPAPTIALLKAATSDVVGAERDGASPGLHGIVGLLVSEGLASGAMSGQELLAVGRPAMAVLAATRHRPSLSVSERPGAGRSNTWPQFRARLAELVRARLGTDVATWRALAAQITTFPGTIPELLNAVAPITPPPHTATTLAPEAAVILPPTGSDAWEAFLSVLGAALDGTRTALWPHLDDVTLRALIAGEPEAAEWAALAATPGRVREAWLEGIPSGMKPGPLRELDACATPEEHRSRWSHQSRWFRQRIRGRVPQLRMFLDVWDRFGAEAVAELLGEREVRQDYRTTCDHVAGLLSREDGVEALRTEVTRGEVPEAQIEAWRTRRDLATLVEETHTWHWRALLREHLDRPFPPTTVWWMAKAYERPGLLLQEAAGILPKGVCSAYTRLMAGEPPEKVLAAHAADEPRRKNGKWVTRAVRAGKVTWDQALEHAHPAAEVLRQVYEGFHAAPRELVELMRDTIKDDADAWIRAARLLPDFQGSVADLLRTAAKT